jgi:FkbH-like protein
MQAVPEPQPFRDQLREISSRSAAPQRLDQLVALSQRKLSYLETIQLDRVIGQLAGKEQSGLASVRLAILASGTADHLLPGIRVAALRRRLLVDSYIGGYGQYRQELLDSPSALHDFKPQVVLFSISAHSSIAAIPIGATRTEADQTLEQSVQELRALWREARQTLRATVIQQTFLNTAELLFGSYESLVMGAPSRLIQRLNELLVDAAREEEVVLLDIARASQRDGLDSWFDVTRWLQAKMEISPAAVPHYGELLARVLAAQRGLSKKCLILDLDNTLWGGVIGDDGIDGIVLGEGSASGEAHLALQRYAKQLTERGIVLAVCSKNDAAIAESAFINHPEMLLKRNDIACFVANWEPKEGNIRHIARQLNLGLDSMVFVDDNPVERAAIRQALPMVAVPELPDDPALYVQCIAANSYFEAIAFTTEDRQRGEQYAANASREAVLQSSGNLQDFLAGLQMTADYGRVRDVDLSRVGQLINKTNQFNLTTKRYSPEEVAALCKDPSGVALQFRLIDRFGDNGLVSAMILTRDPAQSDALEIDTWVMSCRVFGRELEFEAMNIAVELARQLRVTSLRANYIPTSKNAVVENLYSTLGFSLVPDHPSTAGSTRWHLPLDAYKARPTAISRKPQPHD